MYRVWGAFSAGQRVWFSDPGETLTRLLSDEVPRRMRDIADPDGGDRLALIDFSLAPLPFLGAVRAEGLVLMPLGNEPGTALPTSPK